MKSCIEYGIVRSKINVRNNSREDIFNKAFFSFIIEFRSLLNFI